MKIIKIIGSSIFMLLTTSAFAQSECENVGGISYQGIGLPMGFEVHRTEAYSSVYFRCSTNFKPNAPALSITFSFNNGYYDFTFTSSGAIATKRMPLLQGAKDKFANIQPVIRPLKNYGVTGIEFNCDTFMCRD